LMRFSMDTAVFITRLLSKTIMSPKVKTTL